MRLEVLAEPLDATPEGFQEQVLTCSFPGQTWTRVRRRDVLAVPNEQLGEAREALE